MTAPPCSQPLLTLLHWRGVGCNPQAICDDKTGTLQLKHVNGLMRFTSHFTIYAAWNPESPNYLQKVVKEALRVYGRRVVAASVSAVLVSHGKGRKPGGFAAALFIREFVANQFNPWINTAFHNLLMTRVVAGPGFNLQQFGGDSPEEMARLRCILFDGELSLWDQFLNYFAALPEAQKPAVGTEVTTFLTEAPALGGSMFQEAKFSDDIISKLAVVKHGLFEDVTGKMNYNIKSKDSEGLNPSIFNGIEVNAAARRLIIIFTDSQP